MSCKKILFVSPGMRSGGAERVMSILANNWTRRGIEVSFLVTQTEAESFYELDEGIRLDSIYSEVEGKHLMPLQVQNSLRKYFKREQPDCVICFFIAETALCSIALRGMHIPLIYSERNDPSRFYGSKSSQVYRHVVEKKADGYVFQTNGAKNCYPERVQQLSTVIINPLDVSRVPARQKKYDVPHIISVGRLTRQKRMDVLIDAFAMIAEKFPDVVLDIYGSGDLEHTLQAQIDVLGLGGRVILQGNSNTVMQEVAASDLFVMTSDFEGIPNALIEALAVGVPCISTDCSPGGARMLIEDGENGFIVPCGQPQAVAEKMELLLSDGALASQFAGKAVEIKGKVEVDTISGQWLAYLDSMVE